MPVTPESNRAQLSRLEQLLGEYDKVRASVGDARARTRKVTGTASSADCGIRVTVNQRGALTGLEIDARTYRKSSPTELAESILDLAAQATRDASAQMAEILRPFLPRGMKFDDIVDGTAEVSIMPTEPLTDATFDQWWAGIGHPKDPDDGGGRR